MSDHDTDAERREAIVAMFTPRDLDEEPAEPPIEGLAPKDKRLEDYTAEEGEAQTLSTMRTMREREDRDERERQQRETDATRTPEQQHGDAMGQLLAGKSATDAAFFRMLHSREDPE